MAFYRQKSICSIFFTKKEHRYAQVLGHSVGRLQPLPPTYVRHPALQFQLRLPPCNNVFDRPAQVFCPSLDNHFDSWMFLWMESGSTSRGKSATSLALAALYPFTTNFCSWNWNFGGANSGAELVHNWIPSLLTLASWDEAVTDSHVHLPWPLSWLKKVAQWPDLHINFVAEPPTAQNSKTWGQSRSALQRF